MRTMAAIFLAAACSTAPVVAQSAVGTAGSGASVRSGGIRSGGVRVPNRPPGTPPPPGAVRDPIRHPRPGVFRAPEPDPRLGAGGVRPRGGNIVRPGTPDSKTSYGSIITPGTPPRNPAPPPKPREPRGPRTLVYPVFVPVYGYDLGAGYEEPYVEPAEIEEEPQAAAPAGPQRIGGHSRVIEFRDLGEPSDDDGYTLVGLRGGLIYAARELEIDDEVVRFTTVQGDRFVLSRAELDEEWTAELNANRKTSSAP